MKNFLVSIVMTVFTLFGSSVYANEIKNGSKINITQVKHEYYKNVLQIKIVSEEPIAYVFLRNPEGEILYSEKIQRGEFVKNFSLNVEPEELESEFTFEVIYDKTSIKYDFTPSKVFGKK